MFDTDIRASVKMNLQSRNGALHFINRNWYCTICLLFLMMDGSYAQEMDETPSRYRLNTATVEIMGTTNINTFNCNYEEESLNRPIFFAMKENLNDLLMQGLEVAFPIAEFACDKHLMTREFQELLCYKEYPEIIIRIDQIFFTGSRDETSAPVSARVMLSLAGKQSPAYITDARLNREKGMLSLSGFHRVEMTSFGIEPPVRFFGAVRAKKELDIGFELVFYQKS